MQILDATLLPSYKKRVKPAVKKCFQQLSEKELTVKDFKNYMIAGAVASSR